MKTVKTILFQVRQQAPVQSKSDRLCNVQFNSEVKALVEGERGVIVRRIGRFGSSP